MINRIRTLNLETLPDILPVFPLPGAMLLPGGQLPLNIFEPRYLNMVEDALAGARLIGMIQPLHESTEQLVADGIRLYDIGCAGRMSQFSETGDGRYIIALDGLIRFRVAEELPSADGYRRVRADYSAFAADMQPSSDTVSPPLPDRPKLVSAMTRYFEIKGIEADLTSIENAPDALLVDTLAMTCPLDPGEKQALLECNDRAQRARLLTSMFEIAAYSSDPAQPGTRQ
ncbi:MAG: LON peptidase substrate-binding domain-containing protein [Rhodospirillales bacterium]